MVTAETGGIAITPQPSSDNSKPKAGYPMTSFFVVESVDPVLYSVKVHLSVCLSVCLSMFV